MCYLSKGLGPWRSQCPHVCFQKEPLHTKRLHPIIQPKGRPWIVETIVWGGFIHDGIEEPHEDRRQKEQNRSCGVLLVFAFRSEWIECSADSRTCSHWLTESPWVLNARSMAFHKTALILSHCPLPQGLHGVVRVLMTPRLDRNSWNSLDSNWVPRSLWTDPGGAG